MLPGFDKVAVTIEVALSETTTAFFEDVRSAVLRHCTEGTLQLRDGPLQLPKDAFVAKHVSKAHICVDSTVSDRLGRTSTFNPAPTACLYAANHIALLTFIA